MTLDQLISFGRDRHGEVWITPLAAEINYTVSGLWRLVERGDPLPRRLVREIERLKQQKAAIVAKEG
jgi:hypothetical protein